MEDLLQFPGTYSAATYAPDVSKPAFDLSIVRDLEAWVRDEAENIIFLYGALDPWSAAAFEVPETRDVVSVVVAGEAHSVGLLYSSFPAEQRARVLDLLQSWTGVTPEVPADL